MGRRAGGPQRPAAAARGDLSEGILADAARRGGDGGRRASGPRSPGPTCSPRCCARCRGAVRRPAERVPVAERVTDLALGPVGAADPARDGVVPDALRRPDGSSRFRARDTRASTPPRRAARRGGTAPRGRAGHRRARRAARGGRRCGGADCRDGSTAVTADQADAVCRGGHLRAASSTSSSGRPGPGSRPRWPGSAPLGRPATGREAWSGWRRPRPPRRSSPTRSGCRRRTPPNGSPNIPTRRSARRARPRLPAAGPGQPLAAHPRALHRAPGSVGRDWTGGGCVRASWSSSTRPPWPARSSSTAHRARPRGRGEGAARRGLGPAVPGPGRRSVQAPRDRPGRRPAAARRAPVPARVGTRRLPRPALRGVRPRPTAYVRMAGSRAATGTTMLDVLFEAWRADTRAGRRSLMMAADAQTVADLNARARADRVATGEVTADGVAGRGRVHPRGRRRRGHPAQPARPARRPAGWVKNGDQWIVTAIHDDGSIKSAARRQAGTSPCCRRLCAGARRARYATTAHRAQGRTVDTAHAFVSAATVREPLYVMATRGRESNRLYVDTRYDPDSDTSHDLGDPVPAVDVLTQVLARSGAESPPPRPATTRSPRPAALPDWTPRGPRSSATARTAVHRPAPRRRCDAREIEAAKSADLWRPLLERMRRAEQSGLDLRAALQTASERERPDQPLLARVDAGLRAWNAAHDNRRERTTDLGRTDCHAAARSPTVVTPSGPDHQCQGIPARSGWTPTIRVRWREQWMLRDRPAGTARRSLRNRPRPNASQAEKPRARGRVRPLGRCDARRCLRVDETVRLILSETL